MFIKTILQFQLGSLIIETREGDNFQGKIDMDSLYGTLTFTLPYQALDNLTVATSEGQQSTIISSLRLRKNMLVRLYFKELQTNQDVNIEDMDLIFNGKINKVPVRKEKTNIDYTIECEGTLAFSHNSKPTVNVNETEITSIPYVILQRGNLQAGPDNEFALSNPNQVQNLIPIADVKNYLGFMNGITAKVNAANTTADVIKSFRDRYGIIFIQQLSGEVYVYAMTGLLLQSQTEAWEFDTNKNIFNIEYTDTTSDIDAVIVYGRGGAIGEALDILKIQSKGITPDINGNYNVRTLRLERRDIFDEEALQKIAREKLLEINKNNLVTFSTKFDPDFKIGDLFTINDYDFFSGSEVFFIKSIEWSLAKTEYDCTITGFANSLAYLPENIIDSSSSVGLADVDTLGITTKVAGGSWISFA